jgi:hypothetical protein
VREPAGAAYETGEMVISDTDQEVYDYDWFAVDKEGHVGRFSTGGNGAMPKVVAASREDLQSIADFFNALAPSTEATLAPRARKAAGDVNWRKRWTGPPMDAEAAAARCFEDFMRMARRGLYSFDHSYALDHRATRVRPCSLYYRIAIPIKSLHVADLPVDVRTVLNRLVFTSSDFSHDDEVNVE